ncbi:MULTISPECIES: YgcG family protein [unclassified Fibrobacter]|uniref:TPM domain-containing protein n=1 Tax=unclassified Fibrobacter TaxID=2634177 RepID=UPI000D6AB9FD|nr:MULTISPECIES: TPM domain-containing protein [unclassified Fibrobacter]PWJ71800.1 uncharacterized protein BGX12_10134 [Fibrobacter sp. UWR4]PZW73715.1 uncharacterized protein C8E88_100234 [Fibrobacter sp. UWR1]
MKKLLIALFALVMFAHGNLSLEDIPSKPSHSYVYDENKFLTAQEIQRFDELSDTLYSKAGVALACVIVNDIGDVPYREYAAKLAEKWNIGGKSDEGVLIFVAFKQKKKSIEIGYKAEDYLPVIKVEKIQHKTIVKSFRTQNYNEGILEFAYQISKTVAKEKNISLGIDESKFKKDEGNAASMILFFLFVLFMIIGLKASGRKKGWLGTLVNGLIRRKPKADKEEAPLTNLGGFGGNFGGVRSSGLGGSFGGGFGGSNFGSGSSFGGGFGNKKW